MCLVEFPQGHAERRGPVLVLDEGNLGLLVRNGEDGGEESITRPNGGSELSDESRHGIPALEVARCRKRGRSIECLHEHGAPPAFKAPFCLCFETRSVETLRLVDDVDFECLEGEETDKGFAGAETDGPGDDFLEFGRGKGPLGSVEGETFPWDGGRVERDGGRWSKRGWGNERRGGCLLDGRWWRRRNLDGSVCVCWLWGMFWWTRASGSFWWSGVVQVVHDRAGKCQQPNI